MTTRREFLKTAACVPFIGMPTIASESADNVGPDDRFRDRTAINLMKVEIDDPATFALIQRGETKGVFQLEEPGIQEFLRRMQPSTLEELIATIVLYRPSPIEIGLSDAYINRKHGREAVHYLHPVHEEILGETHGLILYREQVMQLLHRIGGIDLADGWIVIKAIAKNKDDVVHHRRAQFMDGARQRGIQSLVAKKIFEDICRWAGYSYLKAHAVAHGHITYQTAYLKAHYPEEFAAAVADQVKCWSNQP